MDSATKVKTIVGIMLFGVWVGLVVARLTPVEPLVEVIKIALTGLAAHTLISPSPSTGDTSNEKTS